MEHDIRIEIKTEFLEMNFLQYVAQVSYIYGYVKIARKHLLHFMLSYLSNVPHIFSDYMVSNRIGGQITSEISGNMKRINEFTWQINKLIFI